MNNRTGSWSILPATRVLFNKNKVALGELAQIWKEGTAILTSREIPGQTKASFMWIHGCGHSNYGVQAGDRHEAHHDQTLQRFSTLKILEITQWVRAEDGSLQVIRSTGWDPNMKASLAVFK